MADDVNDGCGLIQWVRFDRVSCLRGGEAQYFLLLVDRRVQRLASSCLDLSRMVFEVRLQIVEEVVGLEELKVCVLCIPLGPCEFFESCLP